MNQKERTEIRRHIAPNRCGISSVYGCFVNGNGEILSYLDESLGLMTEFEVESYLGLFKKVLSGELGKNLLDLVFSTQQVVDSEEHRLLSGLWNSALSDSDLRKEFFQKAAQSLDMDGKNYLILLAHDAYDVPYRGKDDQTLDDASDGVYRYLLCAVCPVKDGKPALTYSPEQKTFHGSGIHQIVAPPTLGFLFPTFDDRATNLYNALYYVRHEEEIYPDFIDAIFHTETPMSPAEQKETFQSILMDTLDEACSYDVVQTVHEQLHDRIEAHKESKDPEPLDLSSHDLGNMLRESGVSAQTVQNFEDQCAAQFGPDAPLKPVNLIDKGFKVQTPQAKISVNPDSSYQIETRRINGHNYLLIPADDGVEINGIPVTFPEESSN